MSRLLAQPLLFYQDANGKPLPGALCNVYLSGTSTPATIYQDGGLTVPHTNPVVARTNGYFPAMYGKAGVDLKLILTDSSGGNPLPPIDPASPFVLTQDEIGEALYPLADSELAANIVSTVYPVGDVLRYGADPTGTTDSTTAFNNALAAVAVTNFRASHKVFTNGGDFRIDGTVTIAEYKTLELSGNTRLIRKASGTTSQAPVVHVKGNWSVFDGGGGSVWSENNSPTGVVCCGHLNTTTSNWNATDWQFKNCIVQAKDFGGPAASPMPGDLDGVGVYIPSSQPQLGSGSVNYFGTLENIKVQSATTAYLLTDLANGHKFYSCTFRGYYKYGFRLHGAYGNTFFGGFLELAYQNSTIAILLSTKLAPAAPNASSLESGRNQFYGFTYESGGTDHVGVRIEAGCQANKVHFTFNSTGFAAVDVDTHNEIFVDDDVYFTQHLHITNGLLKAGGDGVAAHYIGRQTANGGTVLLVENTNPTSGNGVVVTTPVAGNDTNVYMQGTANSVITYQVLTSGGVRNTNNSYGAISDARLKDVIELSGSQWEDMKFLARHITKYRMKSGGPVQIGLIAQDIEERCPGLVNDDGSLKSVNYSVAYVKAIKALGEALERIEALEARTESKA